MSEDGEEFNMPIPEISEVDLMTNNTTSINHRVKFNKMVCKKIGIKENRSSSIKVHNGFFNCSYK